MSSQKENEKLLTAARDGDIIEVETALHNNVSAVNCTDAYKKTPLHWAAENGHADIVNVLIDSNANVESKDEWEKRTPLHFATEKGHIVIVNLMINSRANIESRDWMEKTPLHCAAENGHTDIVNLLINSKGDIESRDKSGWTPLHWASYKGHVEVVQLLLAAGASKDVVDYWGATPLYRASSKGCTEVVELLLAAGANKDIANENGDTALKVAKARHHHEVVQLLEGHVTIIDTGLKWNIDNFDEEQVFEKPEYGVKLVIPSSSVQESQSIDTTVQIVKPDVTLPPNVEPVSCFYKIETSGSFVKPIELHLQHNVDVTSSDNRRLAFVTSSGSPPYKFEFSDVNDQMFDPNDNSGVVRISHFSAHVFGIVWRNTVDTLGKILHPNRCYALTPFYKQINDHCWQLKVVITQNLGPFFEKLKTLYNGWIKKDSGSFYFNPDVNTVTLNVYNQYFDITSLKTPQVDKKEVDDCPFDSEAFPLLHVQVKLKPSCSVSPLKIEFEGMTKKAFIVITEPELILRRLSIISKITLSDELLAKEPRKKHLVSQLNPIKYQWYSIGIQLEVQDGDLKTIQLNPIFSSDSLKLSEVFQKWSDGQTIEVSWRTILDIIINPPISNKKLFYDVQKFLSSPKIQRLYLLPETESDVHQKTFPVTPSLEEATEPVTEPPPVVTEPPPVAKPTPVVTEPPPVVIKSPPVVTESPPVVTEPPSVVIEPPPTTESEQGSDNVPSTLPVEPLPSNDKVATVSEVSVTIVPLEHQQQNSKCHCCCVL